MQLFEIFDKYYTKNHLTNYAKLECLKGISKLNKEELAKRIAEKRLETEVFTKRVQCMTDGEFQLFQKAMKTAFIPSDEDMVDTIFLCTSIQYGILDEKAGLVVPDDVIEKWNEIDTPEFEQERKRVSWIRECMHFVRILYGFAPVDVVLQLISTKKGMNVTETELEEILDGIPFDLRTCIVVGNDVVDIAYALDMDGFRTLGLEQKDKPYFIPSCDEIIELSKEDCLLKNNTDYKKLEDFLIKKMKMEKKDAKALLIEMWKKVSQDEDFHDTLQWFMEKVKFPDEHAVNELMKLYMDAANNTNLKVNRGYSPKSFPKPQTSKKSKPTIVPMSTQAVNVLSNHEREIRNMGFGYDASNYQSVGTKKVYPNDPCPCGSGKKYKKCCGRK